MLGEALEFYQGFLRQEGDDPAVRGDSARAYSRSITLRVLLGQLAEAEQAAAEARRLYEGLIAEFPDRPEYRNGLANTHRALAHVCLLAGRIDRAQQAYRDEVALGTELVGKYPAEMAYRETLSQAHRSLGVSLGDQDPPGAERHLRQAIEHARVMVQAQPGTAAWECLLASAHAHLGMLLVQTNQIDKAAIELESARQRLEPAGRAPPAASRDYPSVRALALVYRGAVALRQGRPAEAEPLLRDGVAAYEELVRDVPNLVMYRVRLHSAYTFLAPLYENSGRRAQAEAAWQKAIECMEQTARTFPPFAPMAAGIADQARLKRWLWALRRGEHAAVMAEVGRLEAQKELAGPRAYNLAWIAAKASEVVGSDARLAEEYARRAMALLIRAEAADYFRLPGALQHARTTDKGLDSLRQRSDFRRLMDRLQKTPPVPQADAKPR
jgi:tetratricopeptide (TPR) repeat protein